MYEALFIPPSIFFMTENLLLLRSAATSRYFILGTDFPCARVFDASTSSLVGVLRSERLGVGLLTTETLTAVAIGPDEGEQVNERILSSQLDKGETMEVQIPNHYAVAGFSNGTVIIHNVEHNLAVEEVLVSPTQQAVLSMSICNDFLWCLTADNKVSVVPLHPSQHSSDRGEEELFRFSSNADGSCITVVKRENTFSSSESQKREEVFDVLVAGASTSLYTVTVHRRTSDSTFASSGRQRTGAQKDGCFFHVEKGVSFASQGSSVSFAWMSRYSDPKRMSSDSTNDHPSSSSSSSSGDAYGSRRIGRPAVTGSPQDTTIRIWDVQSAEEQLQAGVQTTENLAALHARCRRTLVCGQRIAHISVLEGPTHSFVAATTFTGAVLMWVFTGGLLSSVPETLPLFPDMVWYSPVLVGKLLMCQLLPFSLRETESSKEPLGGSAGLDARTRAVSSLSALLLRGSFALPHFDRVRASQLLPPSSIPGSGGVAAERTRLSLLASLAIAPSSASSSSAREWILREVPLSTRFQEALELRDVALESSGKRIGSGGGEAAAFETLDVLWSKHRAMTVVAIKASGTPTEAFRIATPYKAPSMTELPVQKMTLEQRLREMVKRRESSAYSSSTSVDGTQDHPYMEEGDSRRLTGAEVGALSSAARMGSGSSGLASVPLYQALHANDVSAVMELLSVTSSSSEAVRATVMSLQLPYCLQLLSVLSERLGICSRSAKAETEKQSASAVMVGGGLSVVSSRSPLLQWIDAIIQYRGMEMHDAQITYDAMQKKQLRQKEGKKKQTGEDHPSERHADLATETPLDADIMTKMISPPKAFIAPILHEYRRMTNLYDSLATLHGRMGVFLGVRPSEKHQFYNRSRKMLSSNMDIGREDAFYRKGLLSHDIVFPATFAEVASRKKGGNYVVKVKSKAALRRARDKKRTTDSALFREAEKRATKALRSSKKDGLLDEDDDNDLMDEVIGNRMAENGGELNFEELEEMGLDDEEDEEQEEEEDVGEPEDDDEEDETMELDDDRHAKARLHKRSRNERSKREGEEVMLADQRSEEDKDEEVDIGAHSDSSSAREEFSEGSDDALSTSSLLRDSEEVEYEDEDEDEDEEDSLVSADEGHGNNSDNDDSDDDEDDGMEEGMAELLKASGVTSSSKGWVSRIRVN